MALEAHVGNFQAPGVTGTDAITGVGFQPKLVMILSAINNSLDGSMASTFMYIGAAVSTTSRFAYSCNSWDNRSAWNKYQNKDDANLIHIDDVLGNDWDVADLDSFDADGFTLDYSVAKAEQRYYGYLALGGDDLTNVAIKEFDAATSTGTDAITGVGFQPDAVIIVVSDFTSTGAVNQADDTKYSIGFSDGTTDKAVGGASFAGVDGYEYSSYQSRVIDLIDHQGTQLKAATIDSLDVDGFTLDYTTADANAYKCFAICLKGARFHVGEDSTPGSTGTFSVTGTGFTPKAVFVTSTQQTAATATNDRYLSLGIASGVNGSEHYAIWNGSEDAPVSNSIADRVNETDRVLPIWDEGTPTLSEDAEVDSFDADGITWELLTASATAHLFGFLAMGDAPAAATAPAFLQFVDL